MENETYLWIGFFILVVIAGIAFHYLYKPELQMFVAFNVSAIKNTSIYPYQKVSIPFSITNTGGADIVGMNFEILVNGNVTSYYKATIPQGKVADLIFNFSPTTVEPYNISIVADPAKVYAIANRKAASNTTTIHITSPELQAQNNYLPKGNITFYGRINMNEPAFVVASFLASNYSLSRFSVVGNSAFLATILNITQNYLKNVSSVYAHYGDGSYSQSVWISGYLSPSVTSVAATGKGLKWSSYIFNNTNYTQVNLGKNTTQCSWYSGGWLKTLIYYNTSKNCMIVVSNTNLMQVPSSNTLADLYQKVLIPNSLIYGSASNSTAGNFSVYAISRYGNEVIAPVIQRNGTGTLQCFGIIDRENNQSYCNTYILPKSGTLNSSFSVVRTTTYVNGYNLSVFSIVNSTQVFSSIPIATKVISSFGLNGIPDQFQSGFASSCNLGKNFSCKNATYFNSSIKMRIGNLLNQTAKLRSIRCYYLGNSTATILNQSVAPGNTVNILASCYNSGSLIQGIPAGLHLSLYLNYTVNNTPSFVAGNAIVNYLI